MRIARLLQSGYWLEPAGSHGAQGLDDYHFAVFSTSTIVRLSPSPLTRLRCTVFGSAQLRDHKYLRPKCIHDNEILDEFAKDYMYLSYVRYINSVRPVLAPLGLITI